MARCLAAAMSQQPVWPGTPATDPCSSAMTSVSCANSSARPTSWTMRAKPAMIRADSMRQTASTTRRGSVAVMATDPRTPVQAGQTSGRVSEVLGAEYLQHVSLAFPALPQVAVELEKPGSPFHRFLFGLDLVQGVANGRLRLGERAVGDTELAAVEVYPGAGGARGQARGVQQRTG